MPALIKNVVAPLVLLAVAVGIAVLMLNSRAELPKREPDNTPPLVDVSVAHPGPVPVTIHSRGMVTPRLGSELVSEVSGRVIWASPDFLQGGRVSEGQLLLRIDPIDYEVAVSDAKAALASAELSLAEVSVVKKEAAITEAEARVEAAKARLRQAEVNLQNTEIKAPFNAVVDDKRADFGQYVATGTAVMKLLGTDLAEVRLPVLASDVPWLTYGKDAQGNWQPVTLTASFGTVDYSWQGRLVRLERRVDSQTRAFFLVAEVDKPYDVSIQQRPLVMGLFVEATFSGAPIDDAVRLPRTALQDGDAVYVVTDGKLHLQDVKLMRREQDSVIVRGLQDGQQVVTSRLDLMVEGMAVAVAS